MIILATVSINAVFGERGLIKRAEQSNDVHGEQAAREKLVLKLNEYKIEIYEEKITKADEKDKLLKQRLEEVGPTAEAEDPKYYEVEVDGWIFWVNRDTLEILSRGKAGKTVPVITNVTLTTGKNDIKVDTAVIGGNEAKYKYYYKKEGETTYTLAKETDTPSYTITGLEENKRYTVKIEVTNENGTASKEAVGRTGIVPNAEGAITFGSLVWNNGKAEVTITKTISDDLEIQYKIDTGEYKTITSGSKVTGLELNSIVTARLWDGLKGGNTASLNVQDETNPNEATITLSKQTAIIGEKITADVSQSDNESGIDITKCRWIYNQTSTKLGEDETNYTGKFTSANETISLTTTNEGDYYLHVLTVDRAGNKTEKISGAVTVKEIELTNISLNKTETTINTGKTETLTVVSYTPSDAKYKDVRWTTTDDTIAKVDETTGLITGIKAGTVTITAISVKYPSVKAECKVTVEEIVEIANADDLKAFRDNVNAGNRYDGVTVKVIADINLNGEEWTPIGNTTNNRFFGEFDGQGHTIEGLYINKETKDWQGLFGAIYGKSATSLSSIKNINLKNVNINAGQTTGGIVGTASDIAIEGCSVTGIMKAQSNGTSVYIGGIAGSLYYGSIKNCFNGSIIQKSDSGTSSFIGGGICGGTGNTKIENCYNYGKIGNSKGVLGGIIGSISSNGTISIYNCYNLGEIDGYYGVGGITGSEKYGDADYLNCYNSGSITTGSSSSSCKGGIIGTIYKNNQNNKNNFTLTNCKYKKGTATDGIGSIECDTSLVKGEATETETMPDVLSVINGDGAFEADPDGSNGGYPILKVK